MDEQTTVLKIPYIEYPTVRRLSLAFAVAMASEAYEEAYDFDFKENMLIVKEPVEKILPRTFDSIIDIYKSRKYALGKEVSGCPKLITNINDYTNVGERLAKKLGFTINKRISICEFFVQVIEKVKDLAYKNPMLVKNELRTVKSEDGVLYLGTEGNDKIGEKNSRLPKRKSSRAKDKATISHLQLFKLEKYEYGKDHLSYTSFKGSVEISPVWYGVLSAGWLLTFAGYRGGTILNVIIDDHIALSRLIKKDVGRLMSALKEYTVVPFKANYPPTHTEAYLLMLALSIDPRRLVDIMSVPLRYSRTVYVESNHTYTIIEEFNMDVSPIYKSISIILTQEKYVKLVNAIKHLLGCTLRAYAGEGDERCYEHWGDVSNMSSMVRSLWNIIMNMDPYTNAYKLIRLSPSEGYNFRDPNLAKLLFDWIREIRK